MVAIPSIEPDDMVARLSIEPDDDIVAMLSIDPDTIVSADAASRQRPQRPPGASGASALPHRGHAGEVIWVIRRSAMERLRAEGPFQVLQLLVNVRRVRNGL